MGWRRLLAVYVIAALLAAEYWLVERPREEVATAPEERRARMFALAPDDVVRVELGAGTRRVEVALEGEDWTIVRPNDQHIPLDLVRAFIEAVVDTEIIDRMPADGRPPEDFGFGPEAAQVRMWDRAGTAWSLEMGSISPTGTAVSARHPAGAVALVGRTAQYYYELIVDAVRAAPTVEPNSGRPVASIRLTMDRRAG
jgi:hypothetical protein